MIIKTNQKRSYKPGRCLNEAYNQKQSAAYNNPSNDDILDVMLDLKDDLHPDGNWCVCHVSDDCLEFAFTLYDDYRRCNALLDKAGCAPLNSKLIYDVKNGQPRYAYCLILIEPGVKDAYFEAFRSYTPPVSEIISMLCDGEQHHSED